MARKRARKKGRKSARKTSSGKRATSRGVRKISKEETLQRTRKMIARVKKVSLAKVQPTTKLREELKFTNEEIKALEVPIETRDFADVGAKVAPSRLASRRTVIGIAGVVWAGIPKSNKKP